MQGSALRMRPVSAHCLRLVKTNGFAGLSLPDAIASAAFLTLVASSLTALTAGHSSTSKKSRNPFAERSLSRSMFSHFCAGLPCPSSFSIASAGPSEFASTEHGLQQVTTLGKRHTCWSGCPHRLCCCWLRTFCQDLFEEAFCKRSTQALRKGQILVINVLKHLNILQVRRQMVQGAA